jgi:DNA-binding transcriptional ArsR family regulator
VPVEEEIFRRFVGEVLTPLIRAVAMNEARREDVRATIDTIMKVSADFATSLEVGPKDLNKPSIEYTVPATTAAASVNGSVATALERWLANVKRWSSRNRSIARKIEILSVLAEKNGAISLAELYDHLIACGLSEQGSQAAVVTQLSRLRNDKLVSSGGHGFYSRTAEVVGALQTHRRTYPSLCMPDDVRDMIASR